MSSYKWYELTPGFRGAIFGLITGALISIPMVKTINYIMKLGRSISENESTYKWGNYRMEITNE